MLAHIGLIRLVARAALSAFVFALASSSAFADSERSDNPPVDRPVNSIHAGATSVQFLTFGGGYRAPAFRTSGIYLKTHLSDRGALRVGTEFTLDESSGESPPPELPNNSHITSYSVSVSAEIDEYVDATGPVTVFLGFGPYWSRGRYSSEASGYLTYSNVTFSRYSKSEYRFWEVGGSAGAGFEWFFKRKLSLIGRVGASLGFGRTRRTSEYRYGDPYGSESHSENFKASTATASSSAAALGLGLYF